MLAENSKIIVPCKLNMTYSENLTGKCKLYNETHWEGERDGNESKNSWLCHEVSQKTIQSYNYVPINVKPVGGEGISVIFDLTFLPGGREFDSHSLENVKSLPYAPCTPPLLACH